MEQPLGNLCAHEHTADNFLDSNTDLLSESKHVDTQSHDALNYCMDDSSGHICVCVRHCHVTATEPGLDKFFHMHIYIVTIKISYAVPHVTLWCVHVSLRPFHSILDLR
jgi:hypothetical protein